MELLKSRLLPRELKKQLYKTRKRSVILYGIENVKLDL